MTVCLCAFEEDEAFTKTHCAHCFHSECLARWVHDNRVQGEQRAARDAAAAPLAHEKEEQAPPWPICTHAHYVRCLPGPERCHAVP